MTYLDLVCFASIGASLMVIVAARSLLRAARNVSESARALAWAAKTQALSSQQLIGEIALAGGLIRDLAHHQGLHYADPAHDDGLHDDLAHGLNFPYLEEDGD